MKTCLTLCFYSSAAISEVSGGAATLPTRRLLLCTVSRLRDPPGDHQRETRHAVSHRHPQNQETAIRTPTAMTLPVAAPPCQWTSGRPSHTTATRIQNQPWRPRMYIKHHYRSRGLMQFARSFSNCFMIKKGKDDVTG